MTNDTKTFDSDLTSRERRVLDDAFDATNSPRRTRGLILSALVVVTGVVLFTTFGASLIFLAGLTVATLAVSTSEKFVYQRNMEAYESLIRKLVDRLEKADSTVHVRSGVDAQPQAQTSTRGWQAS